MTYIPGNHFLICDRCGFKIRRSQARKTWDGLMVCAKRCWEPRHPLDRVKVRIDKQWVRDPRPRPADVFLEAGDVSADDL